MKVLSAPHLTELGVGESGIHTVIRSYFRLAKDYGIDFVSPDTDSFDVLAIHAGMAGQYSKNGNIVAHTHGLYWTGDYDLGRWAHYANQSVIESARHAKIVTVPSSWVGEVFQRDMRMTPEVLPHGIIWEDWQERVEKGNYVVGYAKNRAGVDVCNPSFLAGFASRFPETRFLTTFKPDLSPPNVVETGVVKHEKMRKIVQGADVFISTTKETWGIAMLEALASGVPVLAFANGGAVDLIEHGVTGYLARPDDYKDLADGFDYCMRYQKTLGDNARERAKQFSWDAAMVRLHDIYEMAMQPDPPTVSVVIPVYNKSGEELSRAVASVKNQTRPVDEIIIVNDGSTIDVDYGEIARGFGAIYVEQSNSGVADARNNGVSHATGKYILCLDSDDAIAPSYMDTCVPEIESDNSLGIVYTGLQSIYPNGENKLSEWPGEFNYDEQVRPGGFNQVPTACLFRKKAFDRVGGYHRRYAPQGAGEEDANLWLRIPSIGFGGKKVTHSGLFLYSDQSGYVSGNRSHRATDWRMLLPWTRDGIHPFASVASPDNRSHPVYQYDEPTISVIIPVGPGHELSVRNALDTVESQSFRKWEVVMVWDSEDESQIEKLKEAYPYIRVIMTPKRKSGAGAARNIGVDASRGPFLLFVDADDSIAPSCMEKMLDEYGRSGYAIYSDYLGKAHVDNISELAPELRNKIIYRNEETKFTIIRHRAFEFDCARADRQPTESDPYIWCNITTLVPKSWHYEIGGFDESMPSWEDVDYWWRMAWGGKCFRRIPEELLSYNFLSGTRREVGRNSFRELMVYLGKKRLEMV